MSAVWIYIDTSKRSFDEGFLVVFEDEAAASAWLEKHDPEGVAHSHPVLRKDREARP